MRELNDSFNEPSCDYADVMAKIDRRIKIRTERKKSRVVSIGWRVATACVAITAVVCALFIHTDTGERVRTEENAIKSKAKVVLASGEEVRLTPQTGSVNIKEFEAATGGSPVSKIVTETGGNMNFVLSDGTKVWINAQSELNFPAKFTSDHRSVELSGEAYFEVARDERRPFTVTAGDMEIMVLGTSFGIEAYANEPTVSATLVSGKVMVDACGQTMELTPGIAAVLDTTDGTLKKVPADIYRATAWMDGCFIFRDDTAESVIRSLARWYDVEFVLEGELGRHTFNGRIRKNDPLPEILEWITLTGGPSFRIEGDTVYVH
jgi:ferric-dicitrate binding protein FerR (iron transport regulator)